MKIDFDSNTQQTKTELDEKFFSIADPAFIFDLLRNKIYSDPIAAVCRELTCNALDAHREVGNGDVPIVVNLPNHQEPYFKVKDFGPGISPQRIDDIYLKYAASTKRDTNDQIGAFGIGAKSPFSYSESFTIVTNHNGKCYNYAAFIDESRIGKLILLSESDTTEPNGTEIIVPVKANDFGNFVSNTEKATRHWKVKPRFTGGTVPYFNVAPVVKGNGWFTSVDKEHYYNQSIKVLVGEIEYALDLNAASRPGLRGAVPHSSGSFADISVLSSFSSDLYLCFSVGEVSLTANRESIYLDAATKQVIKDRLTGVKGEFVKMIHDKVNSFPSFWEACCFVNQDLYNICRNTDILDVLTWNNTPIKNRIYAEGKFSIYEFNRSMRRGQEKIHRRTTASIPARQNITIIMHDCGSAEPTNRHIKKFFDDERKVDHLFVVMPNDSDNEDFDMDDFIEREGFTDIPYQLLSKHNTTIKTKKANDKVKFIISKFDSGSKGFTLSSVSEVKSDKNERVLVYLSKDAWRNYKQAVKKIGTDTKKPINHSLISAFLRYKTGYTVYGVDCDIPESRIRQVFPEIKFLHDCIDATYSEFDKNDIVEALWYRDQNFTSKIHNYVDVFLEKVQNQNSAVNLFCQAQKKAISTTTQQRNMLSLLDSLDFFRENDFSEALVKFAAERESLREMWKKVEIKYPLIAAISSYEMYNYVEHVIDYINMVDAKEEK